MKNAISKAIEGGYYNGKLRHGAVGWCYLNDEPNSKSGIKYETIVTENYTQLDPLFWQCLGKSLGWEKYGTNNTIWQSVETWKYQWHKFIDHIADGGDVDEFFNTLLK